MPRILLSPRWYFVSSIFSTKPHHHHPLRSCVTIHHFRMPRGRKTQHRAHTETLTDIVHEQYLYINEILRWERHIYTTYTTHNRTYAEEYAPHVQRPMNVFMVYVVVVACLVLPVLPAPGHETRRSRPTQQRRHCESLLYFFCMWRVSFAFRILLSAGDVSKSSLVYSLWLGFYKTRNTDPKCTTNTLPLPGSKHATRGFYPIIFT